MIENLPETPNETGGPAESVLEAVLQAAMYRRDCPDSFTLGEYRLGMLAKNEQQAVQAHLTYCLHCQAELVYATEFLDEEEGLTPAWVEAAGFKWRQLRETGQLIIRLLAGALDIGRFQPQALGVKGTEQREEAILGYLALDPDQVGDIALEAAIHSGSDPQHCTLIVRAEIPSRWPDLTGTLIQARAGNWQAEAATDEEGKVVFGPIPVELIEQLSITINFPS